MFGDFLTARASFQLPLLKIGAGARVFVTLQSIEPVWLMTHWIGKRQFICAGSHSAICAACSHQLPRCTGFLVVLCLVGSRRSPFLLEVTPQSWAGLRLLADMEWGGVCVGGEVELRRSRARGALRIQPSSQGGLVVPELGAFLRCASAVAVLFGLPLPRSQSREDWAADSLDIISAKIDHAVAEASA